MPADTTFNCLQIEAVKLATESATKQMEAELANCKRDAAQAAAAHKAAMASWHVELDLQKAEVWADVRARVPYSILSHGHPGVPHRQRSTSCVGALS